MCSQRTCAPTCDPISIGCISCTCSASGVRLCQNTCSNSLVARVRNINLPVPLLRDLLVLFAERFGVEVPSLSSVDFSDNLINAFVSIVRNRSQKRDDVSIDTLKAFLEQNGVSGGEVVEIRSTATPDTPSTATLSDGAIAGIVIGSVAAACLLCLAVFFIGRKKKSEPSPDVPV